MPLKYKHSFLLPYITLSLVFIQSILGILNLRHQLSQSLLNLRKPNTHFQDFFVSLSARDDFHWSALFKAPKHRGEERCLLPELSAAAPDFPSPPGCLDSSVDAEALILRPGVCCLRPPAPPAGHRWNHTLESVEHKGLIRAL